jgi:hypothetical protein
LPDEFSGTLKVRIDYEPRRLDYEPSRIDEPREK